MNALTGEILTLPKMSGHVSTPKSLSGNVGAKTINIGGKGDDGATFTPSVSADGIISWTNDRDLPNPEPVNIKGKDGYSPSVDVEDIEGGYRVTITDKSGPKSFDVLADIEYIVNAVLAALGGQPDVPTVNNTPVVGMAVVGLAVVG